MNVLLLARRVLASVVVQVLVTPSTGAADAPQGTAVPVAVVSVPAVHEDVLETVPPWVRSSWHVASLASVVVPVLVTP